MRNNQSSLRLAVTARTETGRVRERNEDAFVIGDITAGSFTSEVPCVHRLQAGPCGVLLAVSDGMGGEHAGHIASSIVVETLARALVAATPDAKRSELVKEAVQSAHQAVRDAAAEDRSLAHMGATLTAILVRGSHAFIAQVGDSRAYLLRAGTLTQLTHDQSLVQRLVDRGLLEPEAAEHSPFRHVILQAMGHQPSVEVALAKLALREGDLLLLCSDGLTKHVGDDDLRATLLGVPSLDEAATHLVHLANERGGTDNITVVLAGVRGALERSSVAEPLEKTFEILSTYEPPPVQAAPSSR